MSTKSIIAVTLLVSACGFAAPNPPSPIPVIDPVDTLRPPLPSTYMVVHDELFGVEAPLWPIVVVACSDVFVALSACALKDGDVYRDFYLEGYAEETLRVVRFERFAGDEQRCDANIESTPLGAEALDPFAPFAAMMEAS